MRKTFSRLIIALSIGIAGASCSSNDIAGVATKIDEGKSLDSGDYDLMLDYLEEATEASLPRLKETRTMGDIERIEAEMSERYPYATRFSTALLHDYPHLSSSQAERMSSIRDQAREACNH